ncbi:MAG: hypothetical protein ACRDT6_18830 [Micromonosporaceae bacterium]
MTTSADAAVFVLDTTCLCHFALADRLDVLRELLLGTECWTTAAVIEELRAGVPTHPALSGAIDVDWISVARLDHLPEIACFLKWAQRIGSGERDIGEATVLATAELKDGIAIIEDRSAVRVARKHGAVVHGTVWLFARACRQAKLTVVAAENLIEALRVTGMRLPCTGAEFPSYARRHGLLG